MNKLIAITGGTGFIGSEVIRVLKGGGFEVRALVREQSRQKPIPEQVDQVVYGDLSDYWALSRLVKGADFIVNCAGDVRGISRNSFVRANVYGLSNLLNHARKFNCNAGFLHISSIAAKNPGVSPYAFSKRRSEIILQEAKNPVPWTIFRPPVVYGWGDREVLALLKMMRSGFFPVVGNGENRFSMLHVADLARAVLEWVRSRNCQNRIYELDDGKAGGYSWMEIVRNMSRFYNRKIRVVPIPGPALYVPAYLNVFIHWILRKPPMLSPGKVRELLSSDWTCDSSEFIKDTGWQPGIDLNTGLLQQT